MKNKGMLIHDILVASGGVVLIGYAAINAAHAPLAHADVTWCTYEYPVAPVANHCINYSPIGGGYVPDSVQQRQSEEPNYLDPCLYGCSRLPSNPNNVGPFSR